MSSARLQYSSRLDTKIEDEVRRMLTDYYMPGYQERVDGYVEMCLAIDNFTSRFDYVRSIIGEKYFNSQAMTLVSGFGAGSEMILARYFGLGKIYGVEVEQILVEATRKRLINYPLMYPVLYGGEVLPFESGVINIIFSGHVIEHTSHPALYLHELMRVLTPGGFLFIEFPNRYYYIEQHTNLPSLEWLPRPIRNYLIRMISSRYSPLSKKAKLRYDSIVSTNLQQISLSGIKKMLARTGYLTTIVNHTHATLGIIRCIIRRN
jgi:ubiquinone/menaquinone biosynthesis C-methylase UbiE